MTQDPAKAPLRTSSQRLAGWPSFGFMRMSASASCRKAKPRSGSSSWKEETPRSKRMPSNPATSAGFFGVPFFSRYLGEATAMTYTRASSREATFAEDSTAPPIATS